MCSRKINNLKINPLCGPIPFKVYIYMYIYLSVFVYVCVWVCLFAYLTDKMKRSFFQAAVVSILLYGCTTWTLTKRLEKKLDGNYTRMLRAILNNSWWGKSGERGSGISVLVARHDDDDDMSVCPSAFFRCFLSNSRACTELWTKHFI